MPSGRPLVAVAGGDEYALRSVPDLVDRALGVPAESVRLFMIDAAGRLHIVWERVGPQLTAGKGAARRREAVASRQPSVIHLRKPAGAALAIVPVLRDNTPLGVLEVTGPASAVEGSLEALETVGWHAAVVLHSVRTIASARFQAGVVAGMAQLMAELHTASSRSRAVRSAVHFCWKVFGSPAAGWLLEPGEEGFRIVASRGIPRGAKAALARADGTARDAEGVVRSAAAVFEGATPVVTSRRDAVVLIASAPEGSHVLAAVEDGLSLALGRLASASASKELARSVDAGLGWTAHEMRASLLAIEKAIDRITGHDRLSDRDRRLLDRAQGDLLRLSSTVDDLLRWSVGMASIRYRRTDLAELVAETIRALSLEAGGRRVAVDVPADVVVRVDPMLLRIAIENLVRNSLQHGGNDVRVAVTLSDREATVSVHDRGPGVPREEQAAIFEPLVRGRSAEHGGRGLGLVIAKRVVEAHGGTLWLDDADPGSIFRMRIPVGAA